MHTCVMKNDNIILLMLLVTNTLTLILKILKDDIRDVLSCLHYKRIMVAKPFKIYHPWFLYLNIY